MTYFNWKRGNPGKNIPPFKGFVVPQDVPLKDIETDE
jgi:hypothetical protein